MSQQTRAAREQRKAELELALFQHGFEIVNNDTGAAYVRVSTTHGSNASEPLMLDYKRDIANYVDRAFGTAHDVAMHFVHRYAFRTQSWVKPAES
jgi:hypothetical protein